VAKEARELLNVVAQNHFRAIIHESVDRMYGKARGHP